MEKFDAIIVGAGPAGMMAAIRAAERKRKVLIIERNASAGKKLLVSGGGRCNLTNSSKVGDFLEHFSESRNFLRNTFARFFNEDLVSFFEDAGVRLKVEDGRRVFPKSDKASEILKTLITKLNYLEVDILYGERVSDITASGGRIGGVETASGKHLSADHVAVTTGGVSYPETGSTGDGYEIARRLGHNIIPLKPALSGVLIKDAFVRDWQGISLENAQLTLFVNEKKTAAVSGEMIFTHFGVSGPAVLDMSASVYDALQSAGSVKLSINFKPGMDHKKLSAHFLREFGAAPDKSIKNMFKGFMSRGLTVHFLEYYAVNPEKPANQVTSEERKRLVNGLLDLRLTVEGVMPIKDSIVTRGGVDTKEIDPKTMESKIIKGLFFAGEVIDIDAGTGGYNMQAAFSTGWVCGDNI